MNAVLLLKKARKNVSKPNSDENVNCRQEVFKHFYKSNMANSLTVNSNYAKHDRNTAVVLPCVSSRDFFGYATRRRDKFFEFKLVLHDAVICEICLPTPLQDCFHDTLQLVTPLNVMNLCRVSLRDRFQQNLKSFNITQPLRVCVTDIAPCNTCHFELSRRAL